MTNVARTAAARTAVLGPLLLIAWLFLAAIPALADGGPHVASINNGSTSLTADSCAGCHRAHTAQGAMLLTVPEEELCESCHGDAVPGATTDVWSGVQYALGADGLRDDATLLGALRGGGFDQARIAADDPARRFQSGSAINVWAKVTVGTGADVTSAHLNLADNALSGPTVAWGNGAIPGDGSQIGPGPSVSIGCGTCHNVHGNGKYRILQTIPGENLTGGFVAVAAPGVTVTDNPLATTIPDGDARNYTILQVRPATGGTYMLLASDVLDARKLNDGNPATNPTKTWPAGDYTATGGDYWHVRVPWNSATSNADAPNGLPSGVNAFNDQMTSWCGACHTRYMANTGTPWIDESGDDIFKYRHLTGGRLACTTCHVSHGSNARMAGPNSRTQPFPDGTVVSYDINGATGDSRLLKVDGRGTCQLCHDPTGTVTAGTYTGPPTVPGVP